MIVRRALTQPVGTLDRGRIAVADMRAILRQWSAGRWLIALGGAAVFALVAGLPTDVIPNPLAYREVPVTWWSYPVLATSAVLGGLVTATYVRTGAERRGGGRSAGGGVLSLLAIGCPACNKLVVVLVGTSGALSLWAPLQPLLAVASIVLLAWALWARLRAEQSCAPSTQDTTEPAQGDAMSDDRAWARRPLWQIGLAAGLVAAVASVLVYVVARAAGVPMELTEVFEDQFARMPVMNMAWAALLDGALTATVLAAACRRWAPRPRLHFTALSMLGLIASFILPAVSDGSLATKAVLSFSHLVVAGIIVPPLALALPRRR